MSPVDLTDRARISVAQAEAAAHPGNLFLLARPGSGKTRTVGIRLAKLSENLAFRVAATSYTNVAINEIMRTAADWGARLDKRHFHGTLHQFFLEHVLYPFGHMEPVSLRQPFHLVMEEDWSGWPELVFEDKAQRLSVARCHYRATGEFVALKIPPNLGLKADEIVKHPQKIREKKLIARQRGLVSGSDALFYALLLLKKYPFIATAITRRFTELIVDEAQDTGDTQLECLRIIQKAGLSSLVLVGDLDQSIYSFQGARPELCDAFADEVKLDRIAFDENYRSSQAICDVTYRLSRNALPDKAVGRYAAAGIPPELVTYPTKNPEAAVPIFLARLKALGIDAQRAVILTRKGRYREKINEEGDPRALNAVLRAVGTLVGRYRSLRIVDQKALRRVETAIALFAWGLSREEVDQDQRRLLRDRSVALIATLPDLERPLSEWVVGAREAVKMQVAMLAAKPFKKPGDVLKAKPMFEKLTAAKVFCPSVRTVRAHTIHDVKGESYSAVMVVAEKASKHGDQGELWAARLSGQEIKEAEAEEIRVAYVALTRAETYCVVALPAPADEKVVGAFVGAGFVDRRNKA